MASLTLFATTACLMPPSIPATQPQASTVPDASAQPIEVEVVDDAQAARAAALQAQVDAENAAIPQILEQFSGMYADLVIDGALESSTGDGDVPAGDYAVMRYTYTYADVMDWAATSEALDSQRSVIDDSCQSQLFPAIAAAGVDGPLAAVYSYRDITTTGSEPMWSHTCSTS